MHGISVCCGRFLGYRQFGCIGSVAKPEPLDCSENPQPLGTKGVPKPA